MKQKGVIEYLVNTIKNSEESMINEKRAALWAIAHMGWTQKGINLLKESSTIIETVLEMVQNCEYLPLKGTAFNVANIFSQTECGRQFLKASNWNVFNLRKSDNTSGEFLCLPQNYKNFFHLNVDDPSKYLWQNQEAYWSVFTKLNTREIPLLKNYEQDL